jgi:hypothetical protein
MDKAIHFKPSIKKTLQSMYVLHSMVEEHGEAIMGDILIFTNVESVIQISENLG